MDKHSCETPVSQLDTLSEGVWSLAVVTRVWSPGESTGFRVIHNWV